MSELGTDTRKGKRTLKESFTFALIPVLIMWGVTIVETQFQLDFTTYGLFPKKLEGLLGVITAPFIHSGYSHLMNNSIPFLVLGTIIIYFYRRVAIPVFVLIYLLTGTSVWLLGRSTFHIGASGVVYGLVAFVFWTGILRRNPVSIVLTLIVTMLYSGMFLGILPNQEGISWESHLLGAIAGVFCAYLFRKELEEEERMVYSWETENESKRFFLRRDTFEKTLQQREEERRKQLEDSDWVSTNTFNNLNNS